MGEARSNRERPRGTQRKQRGSGDGRRVPDFVAEARERSSPTWDAIHAHPFVRGIGDGTLSPSRRAFYLHEDYLYLLDFCRVLGLAAARAPGLEDMRLFSRLLNTTIDVEIGAHVQACAEVGIGLRELETRTPSLATLSYAGYLLRTGYDGGTRDLTAALLPCYAGYVEIAERLQAGGLPRDPWCRAWIEAYGSAEMRENAGWLARRMNAHAAAGSAGDRERWLALYAASARFELLFFDTCWDEEPMDKPRV